MATWVFTAASFLAVITPLGIVAAQSKPREEVGWGIDVRASDSVNFQDYLVYGEHATIPLALMLDNKSDACIAIASTLIAEKLVVFATQNGKLIPTALHAVSDAYVSSTDSVTQASPQLGESITIPALSTLTWYFDLERRDGRLFTAGTYSVEARLNNVESAILDEQGNGWRGRGPLGLMRFDVLVIRPRVPSEVAAMHIAAARELISRLRDEDALVPIRLALVADPSSVPARRLLGQALNVVRRPDESIPVFQQLINDARTSSTRSTLSGALAYAHVLRGDLSSAAGVLRRDGLTEDRIATRVEEMQRNATRPAEPEPSSTRCTGGMGDTGR